MLIPLFVTELLNFVTESINNLLRSSGRFYRPGIKGAIGLLLQVYPERSEGHSYTLCPVCSIPGLFY